MSKNTIRKTPDKNFAYGNDVAKLRRARLENAVRERFIIAKAKLAKKPGTIFEGADMIKLPENDKIKGEKL